MTRVTLYTRAGCCLCAEAKQVLAAAQIQHYSAAGREGGEVAGVCVFRRDLVFQKSCGGAASFASVSPVRSCRRSSSWMSIAYRDQI